jgi:hypothetical protein
MQTLKDLLESFTEFEVFYARETSQPKSRRQEQDADGGQEGEINGGIPVEHGPEETPILEAKCGESKEAASRFVRCVFVTHCCLQ